MKIRGCKKGNRLLAVTALIGAVSGGCARNRFIEIDSRPAGAPIYVNGEGRGATPARVRLDFGPDPEQRILIQLVKSRYKPVFQYYIFDEVPEKRPFTLEVD